MISRSQSPVVIAGGGPVGAIAALALARHGVDIIVFEAEDRVDESPRAATTHPATLEMLAELGLIDDVIQRGLIAPTFQFWDRPSGRLIAEFDHAALKNETPYPFVVQCEQHKLVRIAMERLRAFPNVAFQMSSRVSALELRSDGVALTIQSGGKTSRLNASYLIGADGGRSTTRKSLGIDFEGYTFPERFLVLTTPFDFAAERGCGFRSYFSDPHEWTNLFKVSGDDGTGLWRAVFPTRAGEADADLLSEASVQQRLQRFLPKAGAYPVVHRNFYKVHQRVAVKFSEGRAFLVGDAAHVNNPIGGLGLNCGIHDAVELAGLLGPVLRNERPIDTLADYDRRRRPINIEYVQQQTIANKKRLEEKDAERREANFAALRATAADPIAHHAFLMRSSLLESVRTVRERTP